MAQNIKNALNITTKLYTRCVSLNVSGTRMLYTPASLGIDAYLRTRENVKQQFHSMTDKFREKMNTYVGDDARNMIFTEDLKNMLHLVDNDPQDMELLKKMMIKFNNQNKDMRFGSFVFGPVIMRTYYYLDEPDEAYNAFIDPAFEGMFDQFMSHKILLDLLYNHSRFEKMKKVFEMITSKPMEGSKYPKHTVTLILAGCYKENTPESMQYALDLWQKLKEYGHLPMRRSSTFFAGLALKQGKPEIAAEVMYNVKHPTYVTVRNIKVAAFAALNRLDDVLPVLRMAFVRDNPAQVKHTYVREVIEQLEEAIERAGSEVNDSLVRMVQQLHQYDHVIEKTLDDLISAEIDALPRMDGEQGRFQNNFDQRNRLDRRVPYPTRQLDRHNQLGLKELV